MQGLADGYFIMPLTIGNYLARTKQDDVDVHHSAFVDTEAQVSERTRRLLDNKGTRSVDSLHMELGRLMWNACGMERSREGLLDALEKLPALRETFWKEVNVPGSGDTLNESIEKAGRVADYFELAELMCRDALTREESCGAHYRVEYTTDEGEARREDDEFAHVAAWEWTGDPSAPVRHQEELVFDYVPFSQRSYK
ncbi:MAG: fumarate reductase/succinate dehydrogenase flavoprotein subunit, partial [Gemmatimonadetes bacterium]|nr:fumarate reductase/succinate dehydrogenase flavoprotein subunit [Gemmatimonadota bacterium]